MNEEYEFEGLLSSVKEDAKEETFSPSDGKFQYILGKFIEDVLVEWVKENQKRILSPYIEFEDQCHVRHSRPSGSNGRLYLGPGYKFKDIHSDYFFIIDQLELGRTIVAFEAKYGAAPIHNSQAQFYRKVYHRPSEVIESADQGVVILAKCYNFNLFMEEGESQFDLYWGELEVPDYNPMENKENWERWRKEIST